MIATRPLGRTCLEVTELGLGGAPLGGNGRVVAETAAEETIAAAWEAGLRYFDTAPWYGLGTSEHRMGRFLRGQGRDEFVLSTKVGRLVTRPGHPKKAPHAHQWRNALPFEWHYDYSYDAVMRSFEDSLQRLGLARVDVLLIHDLDLGVHGSEGLAARTRELDDGGGYRALDELRAAGDVRAIGAGTNQWETIVQLVPRFDLDVVLLAGRYTLLEQEAALAEALPLCEEHDVAVVIGGVFNSGILASGAVQGATYDYEEAPDEVAERARHLADVCERHGVDLPGAALRFPLGHSAVASVIPGAISADEVRQNVANFERPIPNALWDELRAEGLLASGAPVPD